MLNVLWCGACEDSCWTMSQVFHRRGGLNEVRVCLWDRFAVHKCTMYTFLKISFVQIYTFTSLQHLLVHSAIGLPIDAWLPSCSNEKRQPMFRCTTTSKRTGRLMFLFFRGTFVRLFVRFCLQSCFVFRRQSSKG